MWQPRTKALLRGENLCMTPAEVKPNAPDQWAGVKFRLSVMVFVILSCGLLTYLWMPRGPKEPEYAGRTLTQWVVRCSESSADPKVSDECVEAIRQIGTNGLPTLLQMLEAPEEPWRTKVNIWAQRLGCADPIVKDTSFKKWIARDGFAFLGSQAQSALPELLRMLSRCRTADEREIVIQCIGLIGPAAEPAVPALIKAARSGGQSECFHVCWALARIARQPEVAVPFLTDQLSDADRGVRRQAANALGKFTTNAISATPALITLLDDPVTTVRETATNALRRINSEAATKAGIK